MGTEITVSVVVGAVATFVVSVVTRSGMSSTVKRWIALAVYAVLTVLVVAIGAFPAVWDQIVAVLGVIVAAGQTVYTLLKPTGILDWVEGATTPGSSVSEE